MRKQHLYFYYYTNENFRKVVLIPRSNFAFCNKKLGELEGILVTEKEVPFDKQKFSIAQEEEIEKEYRGRFEPFEKYE